MDASPQCWHGCPQLYPVIESVFHSFKQVGEAGGSGERRSCNWAGRKKVLLEFYYVLFKHAFGSKILFCSLVLLDIHHATHVQAVESWHLYWQGDRSEISRTQLEKKLKRRLHLRVWLVWTPSLGRKETICIPSSWKMSHYHCEIKPNKLLKSLTLTAGNYRLLLDRCNAKIHAVDCKLWASGFLFLFWVFLFPFQKTWIFQKCLKGSVAC